MAANAELFCFFLRRSGEELAVCLALAKDWDFALQEGMLTGCWECEEDTNFGFFASMVVPRLKLLSQSVGEDR